MFFQNNNDTVNKICISVFLAAAILAVYWQVGGHEFISYDDAIYITGNSELHQGLTVGSAIWAFTTFHASNWHPLTWLSHLLDIELFGMNPAGHHLVNVTLHIANSILLFLMLNRYTGFMWRSAVVAALFALHPLHVESVAWVSERKDVLSAMFWMLTLYFYAGYARKPDISRYITVLVIFALGLMAKPMLVTLPFIMLLLDYWPLQRFAALPVDAEGNRRENILWQLTKEKIPLVVLVAASCIITIYAQKSVIAPFTTTSVSSRICNATVGYLFYLKKMILPVNLSIFYPFKHDLPLFHVVAAFITICAISITAVRQRQTRPYLFVGWFWYIITLIPVIGIVQVGMQATADRYSYIPLIGIFLSISWIIAEFAIGMEHKRATMAVLFTATISACAVTAWRQVSCWKNSTTVFTAALASTQSNFAARFALGGELEKQGRLDEAVVSYKAAIAENRYYGPSYGKLGKIYYEQGMLDEAIDYYYKELFVSPLSVNCRNNLGIALAEKGRLDEAIGHFTHALSLRPDFIQARSNLERAMEIKNAGVRRAYR